MTIKKMYIDGKWVTSSNRDVLDVIDPADGRVLYQIPRGQEEDVNQAVKAARVAFESEDWYKLKPHERGRMLYKMSDLIRRDKEELATMETLDTGKPISQARSDVEAGARYFEYYGGMADKLFGETIPIEYGILDYTVREPMGVTAHVVPWNYPLQIASRSVAAALATGNAVVLKPAEDTPSSSLKLAELFEEIGLPKGIYNVVTGLGHEAGAALTNHPDIDQITFTGSVETGMAVMKAAAKHVIPVTLELGGKSPNLVFEDCPWEDALNWVVRSIVQNAGQTCSAGSRLLVQRTIHETFVSEVCERMEALKLGKGLEDPDLGPILSKKQFDRIMAFLDKARDEKASVLTGGARASVDQSEKGYYLQPTVIDQVDLSSPLAQEEIFGPVLTVFPFEDEEEALRLANGTPYGLVAGIWTKDVSRAHRLAGKIRAGQIFINNYGAGGGIQMPFGGYKKSGFGREKGLEALRNYTQLKNVAVKYNYK